MHTAHVNLNVFEHFLALWLHYSDEVSCYKLLCHTTKMLYFAWLFLLGKNVSKTQRSW